MQLQLDLFKSIIEEVDLSEKANKLLELLNDGAKEKDRFFPSHYLQINDLVVLIAQNKEKVSVFNVIDLDSNIPPDFSVNWRSAQHVKTELYNYLPN